MVSRRKNPGYLLTQYFTPERWMLKSLDLGYRSCSNVSTFSQIEEGRQG